MLKALKIINDLITKITQAALASPGLSPLSAADLDVTGLLTCYLGREAPGPDPIPGSASGPAPGPGPAGNS